MSCVKALVLSALLIVIAAPSSSVRAQSQTPANPGGSSRSTDEDILREANDLVRRAWRGGEGLAGAAGRLTRLLEDNRESAMVPLLQLLLDGMHEKQAAHNLAIAMFYLSKRGKTVGAESRLKEIVRRYPRYSRLDDVLYQLSFIEYESGRRSEAITTLERLVNEFKFSPRIREARAQLKRLRAGREEKVGSSFSER